MIIHLYLQLITYGENRNAAIETMVKALDAYVIRGKFHTWILQ